MSDVYLPVFKFQLPDIIDGPGVYETRCGEHVVIENVTRAHWDVFGCHGRFSCGIPDSWTVKGRIRPWTESKNDIIKKIS